MKFKSLKISILALAFAAQEFSYAEDSMTPTFLTKNDGSIFEVDLSNDNNNSSLPMVFRSWWYITITPNSTSHSSEIRIRNKEHRHFYLPAYSYDQINWQSFQNAEVTKSADDSLIVKKIFSRSPVYIARSEPYSFLKLQGYITTLEKNPFVKISYPASSPNGHEMPFLTITDPRIAVEQKKQIWLHARTHPGETATSFIVEGLINYLLTDSKGQTTLQNAVFSIVPMHNIDGVVLGNNRTNSISQNLEELWHFDINSEILLDSRAPQENQILAGLIKTVQDSGPPILIALNVHSTNGEPHFYPHFVPHFGTNPFKFNKEERNLFRKQKQLADYWYQTMGYGQEASYVESNPLFLLKSYPETWFWRQYKDNLLAITFEATYGKIPSMNQFFNSEDHRSIGRGIGQSIFKYLANLPK